MPRIPTIQVPNVQNASNNTIVSSVQNGDLVRADALNNSLENVRKVLHHGMGLVNQYQQMRTDSEDILASAELKKLQASKFGEFQQKMAENPFEYEKFEEWRNEYENSFAEEALPIYSKMSDQRRKIMQEEMELQKEDRKNNVLNMMIQADATAKRERFISLYEDGVKRQDGIFLKELIKNCRGKIISDQEADNRLGEIERFSQWYEAKDQIASGAMDITSKLEERSENGAYKNFTQLSESDRSKLISYSRQVQAENIYNSNEEFRSKILTGEVITEEEINKDFESGKINRAQFNDRLEVVKKLNALRQEKELQSQKELEKAELQKKREAASAAAEKFEHDVDAFDLRLLMFEFDPIKEKRMEQRNALQEEILKKYQAEHPDVAARLYKQLNSSFKAADERLTDTNNKASSMRELKNQPNYVYAMQQMKSMINDGQFGYKEKGWLWSSTEEDKSGTIASILPLKIDEFMQNNPDATQEQINNFLQDLKKQVNQTYFKDILSTWGNLNSTNYVKKKFNDNEILRQTRDGRIAVYNSENQFVRYEDESYSSSDEAPAFEDTTSVDSFNISISRDTLKKMFSDDPLAFIEDEQEKASIDYTLIGDGLADENRKKLALSVFYGMMGKINPGYIYDNIEDFIAKYNGGNPQSIKEAYAEVAKMINPNTRHETMGAIKGMEWNRDNWKVDISNMQPSNAEIALESGIANTMTTAANIGNRLLELGIWASGQTPISGQILAGEGLNKVGKENLERQLGEKATVKQRSKDETFALLEEIKKNNTSYWQDIDEKNWEKLNVPDDWVTNSKSVSNFARNAFYSFLREAPNMTFQGAAMLANPMIGTTMIGVTSANDKDYYLRNNYPDMSPSIRITNAVFTGVINGSLERITAGILRGKNFPIDKFSLKSGFVEAAKYYAKSFGKESLEEGTEQLLENTVDVLSGVHGPMRNLTVKETFRDLLQGVPESMAIGGLYGLPFAAIGHKSARDLDRARMGIIAEAEQKKNELLDLKELTPEEKVDLETLDSIIDSADSMEVFDQYQKYAAKKIYKDAMTEYSENDMDINEIASKAEDRIHLRNDIRHDIKQTENSFLHFAASFPKVNMIFYPTRADVPPEVRSELENMNRPIELAKAFVYDGKVCMIGENVRPSQVIRVGTHEVIGHLGLKSVFGDKFDSFLDIVAKQHSSEIEESAKLYNQDMDTVEGVRYATEEFLAKTAESKAELKPHWWNGFLSWIKQQLRQLPMFKNLRVTDREIESAFMRSFKATSKGRTISELSTRFAFDEEGNPLFNAQGVGSRKSQDIIFEKSSSINKNNDIKFSLAPPVESENFKRWFGDSKVVDSAGKPLVVYHQTDADISVFDTKHDGAGKSDYETPHGVFLKPDDRDIGLPGKKQMKLYAKIEKPLVFAGRTSAKRYWEQHIPGYAEIVAEIQTVEAEYQQKYDDAEKHDDEAYSALWNDQNAGIISEEEFQRRCDELNQNTENILKEWEESVAQLSANGKQMIDDYLSQSQYDGVIIETDSGSFGRKTKAIIALNNTQVKSATDNNGSYDPENPDIRYSLSDYSEADRFDLIKAIKPYVGRSMNKSDADYLKFFKDKNLPVYTEADAHEIAATAMYENRSDSRRAAAQKRDKWLYDNLPLYAAAVDYSGPDFKIKVGDRYEGLEITGTFLSEKEGIPSDLLAESIAEKTGGDPLVIEDEIIDFYNDLTKPKLRNMFVKAKEEEITSNRELDRQMKEAYRLEEKQRIDDDVMAILELGNPVNQELFDNDPKVGKRLLEVFFGRRDLRNGDLEAINEALKSDKDAKTYATAFRNAKKAVERDYQNKLKEIQNTVNKKEVDTESLGKQAFDFANEHVDQSYRSEFIQRILELPKYSPLPTKNNPYGRRNMEFQKILEDIIIKGSHDKINDLVDDMKQMAHAAKIKRTAKGIPYSVLPGEQATVNRIADILNWDLPAVAAAINDNMTRQQAENSNYEELLKDLDLLNKFGGLKAKSLTEVEQAYKTLQDIIRGGKYQYNRKLTEKRDLLKNLQYRQIQELNVLNVDLKKDGGKFNKTVEDWLSKNLNIGTSFHLLSIGHDFDKSVSGILYREIEKSTYTEVTKNRKNQERLDDFLKNELGIKTIKQKADFYKRLHEVKESGVHIRVYSSFVQKGGKNQLIKVNGKRIPISIEIPVEDARNLLELRKQGNNVNNYKGNALDGFSLDFLEKQLADFDAGLKYAYDLFGDSAENEAYLDLNENINSELEKDRANKHLRLYFHDPNETWETTELKLSPGAALQILLTWEQKDMRSAMEFNGWTENSIKELKKFIPDDILKLGYQMRSWLEENSAELDRAVFSKYGAHLPGIENYYPTSFRESLKRSADTGSLAYGMGTMSMNPSFLIARKFHLKPVDTEVDAVSMFIRNQIETSHFISWYNTIDLLRGVYGDRYVQAAISNKFGNVLSRKIIDEIKALARGGGDIANGARILQSFYKNWIPSKIILNSSSLLKQIAGAVSYANEIPIKDFFRGLAAANNLNSDYKKWRDAVLKSDYLKNRISGGLDKDLIYLMNPQQSGVSSFSVLADRIFKAAAKPTVYCDLLSVLHGGYSVYLYHKKQAMRAGASEEDAHKRAIMYWQRLTDETQQSAYLKDQNFFQMNQSIWRYFTAFASNPIQVMNLQLRTMAEMRYGDGVTKARAKEKLKRQIVINHILTPILMVGISDMLRNGFDFEEYELEDYMIAMLLGNFNTFVIAGQLANFGLNQVGGIFRNGKVSKNFGGSVYPAIPLVDDASKDLTAVNAIIATIAKNEEYTAEDAANLIQLFGDSTMLVGAFKPNVGRAGAFISAIGNQWERLIKLTKEKK